MSTATAHRWRFFRTGGFDQVVIRRGSDLLNLAQLDQKLWVALACPTRGLEFDNATLDLIDTDKDGRIRAPELLAAVAWACRMVKDPEQLLKMDGTLPLSAINDADAEGQQLLASAQEVLRSLGRGSDTTLKVEDTANQVAILAQTRFNGDGVVPAEATDDEAVKTLIGQIVDCLGAETDRSGKPGINAAKVKDFYAQLQAFSDWWAKGEADQATLLPLGEATPGAVATVNKVRAKVDDFFARCRLAAFDARALAALNRQESEYLALAAQDLKITAEEVAHFPLAKIAPDAPLPLTEGLNPAWAGAIAALRESVIKPLLGELTELTAAQWGEVQCKLAAYESWEKSKAGGAVEKLGIAAARELLAGDGQAKLQALIDQDLALKPQIDAIGAVDKLARFNRDLVKLLRNFVNFAQFYSRQDKAVFQAGRLYLDQRACDLCVRVEDVGKHSGFAGQSNAYLAYCDLQRRGSGEKMNIVAAFTAGDSDYLAVGRNGIFYDRQGRDWDAAITKVVENPISIRQAFWSPYKKLIRWIQEMIAKRAAAADTAATGKLTTAAQTTAASATTGKAPEQKPKIDIGTLAAIGVAVGGITAALGALLEAFFGLGIWMPLGVLALILVISGPSMVIAWLKLRQRCIGPILDANGWAVNARAWINLPFGRSLTTMAQLPAGADRDLTDPYAQSNAGRNWLIAIILLAAALLGCWYFGVIEKQLPGLLPKSGWVLAHEPQPTPPPAPAPTDSAAPAAAPAPAAP